MISDQYNWKVLLGDFEFVDPGIRFKGGESELVGGYEVGNILSNQKFGAGSIRVDVRFLGDVSNSACEMILAYYAPTKSFLTAGLGAFNLCAVRSFSGGPQPFSHTYDSAGPKGQLEPDRLYKLEVAALGSWVKVTVDGVEVLVTDLKTTFARTQAGLWCYGPTDIEISDFQVNSQAPEAFIVMEFSDQFDDLYREVIAPICIEAGLEPSRADETYGPGLVISDIATSISRASVVIADISPKNANVFYEVGYSHASLKHTILLAQKGTELPFDVSPYRVVFYENSIGGKTRLEEALRKHLSSVPVEWRQGT